MKDQLKQSLSATHSKVVPSNSLAMQLSNAPVQMSSVSSYSLRLL